MRVLLWLVALIAWGAQVSIGCADTMDRIRPEKLQAVHEAIETLKLQRRKVSLSSGYDDVRSLLHVHSAFSHDSRGTIDEIIARYKSGFDQEAVMRTHSPSCVSF